MAFVMWIEWASYCGHRRGWGMMFRVLMLVVIGIGYGELGVFLYMAGIQ